ncbi:MAG TPA: gliding motility-associated C-terminal domain-containing protein [Pelobium sp.]
MSVASFAQTQSFTICPGKSITLQPTNISAFSYSWSPASSLNAVDIKNPVATPSQTTTYTVISANRSSTNLVVNGDFEQGNTGFTSNYIFGTAGSSFDQGNYGISNNPNLYNPGFSACTDHTTGSGKMLLADGASGQKNNVPPKATVWQQTIPVTAGRNYAFSAWITNIANGALSSLQFSINGTIIKNISSSSQKCNWEELYVIWPSGTNSTATISIAEGTGAVGGNDFALDDIGFYEIIPQPVPEQITVNVRAVNTPIISGNPTICIDNKTERLTSSLNGGTWISSDPSIATISTSGVVYPLSAGNVSITYKANDICNTPSVPFALTITAPPILTSIKGTSKLFEGQQAQLSINSTSGVWSSSDSSIIQISANGLATGVKEGEAEIIYTVQTPCTAISTPLKITVIQKDDLFIPNAFTPNGDGNNDEFKIYGTLIDQLLALNIFNQWGQLVYQSNDLSKGWSGDFKGKKLPAGVYVFTAKIKMLNGKELVKKGAINLIR